MEHALQIAVFVTAAWAILSLTALIVRARAWGSVEQFAPEVNSPIRGVWYAFGAGMSPMAKESAREHLPTWFAGVGYHLGVFASLAGLVTLVTGIAIGGFALRLLQVLCLLGALCGVSLLIKRCGSPLLRRLSCPDDYVSNLLTTGFAALAFASLASPALRPVFLAEAAALFIYVPLGKIKHCCFFFATRYYMGSHFGRRGTFPPHA